MPDKRTILFVDDEPRILDGLRRAFRNMRQKWEMSFVESGEEALNILADKSFDVVVSDMRMPGMSGADLLRIVMKRYPQIVRIILSGHSDDESIFRTIGPTHQYLSKPCDVETLKITIERACALQELLSDPNLIRLISQMESIPSQPIVYNQIIKELQSPDPSIKAVGNILSKDIGMSARILQLINSAFFGMPQHVSSPVQAVIFLGLETVKNLVLSLHIFSQFDQNKMKGLSLDKLWNHSMVVGALAKRIAQMQEADENTVDNSFIGGLLHDAGKLVLAENLPEKYKEVFTLLKNGEGEFCELEREILGACHAEVGAYLLGLWGLPNSIIEAIAFHHDPRKCQAIGFSPLTAVHIANVIDIEATYILDSDKYAKIDSVYLEELYLADELPQWREIYKEVISNQEIQ